MQKSIISISWHSLFLIPLFYIHFPPCSVLLHMREHFGDLLWEFTTASTSNFAPRESGVVGCHTAQQRGSMCFIFCRLYPATTPVFGSYPVISLLLTLTLYRRCGLAYPYDGRGFVGPKKKTILRLLLINPLWFYRHSAVSFVITCKVSIDLQMYLVYRRDKPSVRQAYS